MLKYIDNFIQEFPYRTSGKICNMKHPIKFLQNMESTCIANEEEIFSLIEYLSSIKILKSPSYIKNKITSMEHCTDDDCDCMDLQYQICQNNKCTTINQTDLILNTEILQKIDFKFYHNFTRILDAHVLFHEYDDIFTESIVYNIEYHTKNSTNVVELSGSVGYIKGYPLITTKYIPYNASDPNNKEMKLEYFNTTSSGVHITLPISRYQKCHISKYQSYNIKFGENKLAKCNLDIHINKTLNLTSTTNYTIICSSFQEKIFQFLLHNISQSINVTDHSKINFFLSNLGNPKNNSANWIEIKTKNFQSNSNILGTYVDEGGGAFICQNLILNIKYEFYYARMSVGDVRKQMVLTNGVLIFGTRLDLKFNINENVIVPIYYDVIFVDMERNRSHRFPETRWIFMILISYVVVFIN